MATFGSPAPRSSHQLRYKDAVDESRLFGYAVKRAGDTEFFVRKALGWALRSYSRVFARSGPIVRRCARG